GAATTLDGHGSGKMGDKLKNPPLVEALCEFRFDPAAPWDWAIPGQMYDQIKDRFPKKAQVNAVGFQLHAPAGEKPTTEAVFEGPHRVQFKRDDESAMVQVGQHLLAINQLPPYDNWEAFKKMVIEVLGIYRTIDPGASITRIGLRYINKLTAPPEGPVELDDYVSVFPKLPGPLSSPLNGYFQRFEIIYEDPPGLLVHQNGLQGDGHERHIVLDLDFFSAFAGKDRPEDVSVWLDRAHDRVEDAFTVSLSPGKYEELRGRP
ncbi:MAG: TIGR04255 family protein, partial [Deferrisomatales bacterium]